MTKQQCTLHNTQDDRRKTPLTDNDNTSGESNKQRSQRATKTNARGNVLESCANKRQTKGDILKETEWQTAGARRWVRAREREKDNSALAITNKQIARGSEGSLALGFTMQNTQSK